MGEFEIHQPVGSGINGNGLQYAQRAGGACEEAAHYHVKVDSRLLFEATLENIFPICLQRTSLPWMEHHYVDEGQVTDALVTGPGPATKKHAKIQKTGRKMTQVPMLWNKKQFYGTII